MKRELNYNINDAHTIESIELNEHEDDKIVIRCVGEFNLNEMVEYLKEFNRPVY